MPQQLNAMSNNIQLTRTATGYGNAEGVFHFRKRTKRGFGLSRDISFGIYFNNSNVDFNRVNDNDTVGGHQVSPDTGQRLDIFVGGAFFKKHNFAFRVGYNELQPAADSATSVEKKKVSVTDYSMEQL